VSLDLWGLGRKRHQVFCVHHTKRYEPNTSTFVSINIDPYLLQEIHKKGEGID